MSEERGVRRLEVEQINARNIPLMEEYRANGGMPDNLPLLLLHHRGAKTGTARVNPVMYRPVGNDFAIFAVAGGRPTNPDWYYNLLAHPNTSIEVGTESIRVVARIASGDERSVIWEAHKLQMPPFADWEKSAAPREIPVVILQRV